MRDGSPAFAPVNLFEDKRRPVRLDPPHPSFRRAVAPLVAPCLLAMALLPALALAQEAVVVPPVEVEATADRKDAVAATQRITTPADLEAPNGPAQAVDRTPGAHVRQAGGPGQAASLSVRGADPQGTLATLDGVPLNSPFLGGADLAALSLLPLDALELQRGGASARNGTDAVGGVLRAVIPDPLDGPFLRASTLFGSFGTHRLKAAAGGTSGRFGGMASAGILTSTGDYTFRDANGRTRQRDHNASLAVEGLARAGFEPAPGHRWGLLLEGLREERDVPGLEQFPSTTARQRNDRLIARLSYEGPRLFGRGGSSAVRAWVRRLGFAFADAAPPMGPAVDTRLVAWGLGGEAEAEVAPWDLASLSAGASFTWDRGDVQRKSQASYEPRRTTAAGRVGSRVGRPGGWWGIEADVRVEWDEGFGVRALPRAGAFLRPFGPFRITANVARAFRLPTLEELYFDAGYVQGNPDLQPEDALTWDAGIEATGAGWSIKAAYFENRARNLVVFLPRSAFLVRAENSGGATMRGVETSAEGRWRWLSARASYTFLHARTTDTGKPLPGRPEHRVAGEAAVEVGPLRVAILPSWQSAFTLDRYGSLSEAGRFRLDARVELRPARGVALALDGMNLTNDRDAVDFLQSPLPGWSLYGSIRLDL